MRLIKDLEDKIRRNRELRGFAKFLSFSAVGGIGVLIQMSIFNFFLFLGFIFAFSKFLGIVGSLTFIFLTNRNFTFSGNRGKKSHQILKFAVVYAIGILVNYFLSLYLNSLFPPGILFQNLAAVSGIIVGLPIRFFGSLFWIFSD